MTRESQTFAEDLEAAKELDADLARSNVQYAPTPVELDC
jgi:hypothetical protein